MEEVCFNRNSNLKPTGIRIFKGSQIGVPPAQTEIANLTARVDIEIGATPVQTKISYLTAQVDMSKFRPEFQTNRIPNFKAGQRGVLQPKREISYLTAQVDMTKNRKTTVT